MSTQTQTKPEIPGITHPMTYAEYLASPEENTRYDIVDGYKTYHRYGTNDMTSPTRIHQTIQGNLYVAFRAYAHTTKRGTAYQSACDVLVQREPLRTRQPDVMLISTPRLRQNPPPDQSAPLAPAPELVVEILSPSDTSRVLREKIEDFCAIDVFECWIVRFESETVEVLRLSLDGAENVASYSSGEIVTSLTFPGLTVAVDDIFAM
jgi:Uma2 family endonuclease